MPARPKVVRASKACLTCRERKVRCNVTTSGVPCASCNSAGIECEVSYAKKPRYRASAKEFSTIPSGYHVFEANILPDGAMTDQISTEPDTNLQKDLRSRIDNFGYAPGVEYRID